MPEIQTLITGQPHRRLSRQLGKRDRELLEWFHDIRFVETSQFIATLVPAIFPTAGILRRRLSKLAEMGYLDRPARRVSPDRQQQFELTDDVRERGRPQDIWALARQGARVLQLDQVDFNRNNGRLRHSSFAHPLMITQVYTTIRMLGAMRLITLQSWTGENRWRGKIEVDGHRLPLVPDSFIELSVPATGRELPIWLECDGETEPLWRSGFEQSSFYKKAIAYHEYWHRDFRPHNAPMLVWTVAKTPARAASLRELTETIDAEGRGLGLFWFTDLSKWNLKNPDRFLSAPIWTTGAGKQVSFLRRPEAA